MLHLAAKRKFLIIALATPIVLLAAGWIYQAFSVRQESARFPPPGRLIPVKTDNGVRRLNLICIGEGEPTVIFEGGGFTNALSFGAARQELSLHTKVCSYDRMGMGWSDPAPSRISVGMLADDLNRLTEQAGLKPPFILVPSSLGGVTVEMFARLHREKVAGLVFVDAANSGLMDAATRRFSKLQLSSICLAEPAARFGVLRALDPFGLRGDGENGARSIASLYRAAPMHTLCGLARSTEATREEFRTAPPLAADMPLIVLIHDRTDGFLPAMFARSAFLRGRVASVDSEWLRLQRQFAQSSSRGAWRVVPGSGHLIAAEQPHVVAAAVLALMNEAGIARGK